jgi:lipopolysaccharide export system permease protein
MKTLAKYLAREIVSATLIAFVALLMLTMFSEFLQELPSLRQLNVAQLLILISANIPNYSYELLPISALIGTLFALAQLANNSEYSVMRTAGVSIAQIAAVVAAVGLVIASVVFVVGEYVVPKSEQVAQRIRAATGSRPFIARAFQSGFWFKDGSTFINIASVLPDGSLRNIRVFEYSDVVTLSRQVVAERATFVNGQQWSIEKAVETFFSPQGVRVVQHAQLDWNTVLTPNMLSVLQIAPERLSLTGLWEYIGHLRANNQDARRFEAALWAKFVYPLATCVLMLIALPFAQLQQRSSGIGGRIFVGILLGLVFIIFNRLFAYLALLYQWPPFLGAVMPALIFLAAATYLMWRIERR